MHGYITNDASALGPNGCGCEICSGHSERGQCDRNPHEVHQEDRGKSPSRRRMMEEILPSACDLSFGED